MISKMTTFSLKEDGFEVLSNDLIKTAAIKLPDGITYDPDFLYMRVKAVSAGEFYGPNKNADWFPAEELKKTHMTFLNAHTFKNHENKNVENAIGDVLFSEWDDKMKCVILLIRIDKRIAPSIVRSFEKGYMTDVSMGCRIEYSICSICGNKAKVKSEYCSHINTMRNKVLDDGRKVYEINVNPKFHDISAVLNGAERSAKVLGIMISGSKVAFNESDDLEKVASFEEEFEKSISEDVSAINKHAQILIAESGDLGFEKVAYKNKNFIQKIAEIKKEIQGKITNVAKGDVIIERFQNADNLRQILKLLYTKYWDTSKCNEIADNIREIAVRRDVPDEVAFCQFLKVLNFAGIELSPKELNDIFTSLSGVPNDISKLKGTVTPEDLDVMDEMSEEDEDGLTERIGLPSMFSTMAHHILPNRDILENKVRGMSPLKVVMVMTKRHVSEPREDSYGDIMNFVKDLMPERSFHRRFMVKRMLGGPLEQRDNSSHFAPILKHASFSAIVPRLLYSAYQKDRVNHLLGSDYEYGISKFASNISGESFENIFDEYIEKTAYTPSKTLAEKVLQSAPKKRGGIMGTGILEGGLLGKGLTVRKALLAGLPLTFGYSALQRSRMNNGEDISGFNRYVAENPTNAYIAGAIGTPLAAKALKTHGKKALNALIDKQGPIGKRASVDFTFEYEGDIFKNEGIDNLMLKEFSKEQVATLKVAAVLPEIGEYEKAERLLSLNSLSSDDIDRFFEIAKEAIKKDLDAQMEKCSGMLGEIVGSGAGSAIFQPKGSSALALAPGAIIDGAILTALFSKLGGKKKPPVQKNPTDANVQLS
jgi:hypothetical protein